MRRFFPKLLIVWLLISLNGMTAGFASQQDKPAKPDTSTQEKPDAFDAEMTRAKTALEEGNITDGIASLKKAAELKQGNCLPCYQLLSQIYFQLGDYGEAVTALKTAIGFKPENEIGLMNMLGVALFLQDTKPSLNESVKVFKQVIERAGEKVPLAYYNLAFAYFKVGNEKAGLETLKKYVQIDPNSTQASQAKLIIENPKLAGEKLGIEFKVKAISGEELSLAGYRGKVILLDFWATWCGPCIVEMPNVKATWEKYKNDNFVIIGISLDRNKKAFDQYVKTEGLTWPQYFEGTGWDNKIVELYGVHAIPYTVLIDQRGVIRAVGLRGARLYKKIGELIEQIKQEKAATGKN
ncbi:MAG: thioredoxin-like domain-containing protein [Acidobacteriota bacterium]